MEYQNTRKLNGVNKFVPSWQPLLWLLESSSSEREWAFQVHRVNEQHIPQWTSDPWPRLPPSVMLSWSHPPGKGLPPQWLLGDFGRPNLSSQQLKQLTWDSTIKIWLLWIMNTDKNHVSLIKMKVLITWESAYVERWKKGQGLGERGW